MQRYVRLVIGSGLAVLMAAMVVAPIEAQKVTVEGSGSGAFEPAGAGGPVNNGAVGYGSCVFDQAAQSVACSSRVYNIVDLTAAHLHVGGPGTSGPVVLPIPNLPLRISGSFGQSWTWAATDLLANPAIGINNMNDLINACVGGGCYLNWHTTVSPAGALRVQLCPLSRAANTINGVAVCIEQNPPPGPR